MSLFPDGTLVSTSVTNANLATGTLLDGGSCCAVTTTAFATSLGIQPNGLSTAVTAVVSSTDSTAASSIVGQACVLFKNGVVNVNGTSGTGISRLGVDDSYAIFSNWWCSNGLYKVVTGSNARTINVTQPIMGSQNQRMELAFAACPQLKGQCGGGAAI